MSQLNWHFLAHAQSPYRGAWRIPVVLPQLAWLGP